MRRPTSLGFACSEHCQRDIRPHVQPDHFPPVWVRSIRAWARWRATGAPR